MAAEAAVLASIIQNPDLYFADTGLEPKHFFEEQNRFLFYALGALIKRGSSIDAFNIMQVLTQNAGTKKRADEILSVASINDFINMSPSIARRSAEDYKLMSDVIIKTSTRRELYSELTAMQNICLSDQYSDDFEQEIYQRIDTIIKENSAHSDMVQLKEKLDGIWDEIEARKRGEIETIQFPWPALNRYVLLENATTVALCANKKQGKSIALLCVAADLLAKGKSCLVIDSELSDSLYTKRFLSHLTKIPFAKLKYGTYNDEEAVQLREALEWLKTKKLVHQYLPVLNAKNLMLTAKRAMYVMDGYDVLILDYIKSDGTDAYEVYQKLGEVADCLHEIAGTFNIPVLCACQATDSGKVADSAKIARNVDSLIMLMQKTPEEIQRDGPECGNKKLFVYANRNGEQMVDPSVDFIDMNFQGNIISYTQAEQHRIEVPY